MSHFGISRIRKDTTTNQVITCLVHEMKEVGVEFRAKPGAERPFEEVANRITRGDHVHVLIKDVGDDYTKGERVLVEDGQGEYFFSHPSNSLFNLPLF